MKDEYVLDRVRPEELHHVDIAGQLSMKLFGLYDFKILPLLIRISRDKPSFIVHKYIFYQKAGDLQKTRESNLSFWKKAKGFSSEMVLNKLAMASLCAVRSVDDVGEGGDGDDGAEEGWLWLPGKVKGEEEGEEWIFMWWRKSPGVGKDLGHSGHG